MELQKPCAPTTRSSLTTGREGDHFCFAKIRFEQETATACPSKRVPYSVQQTGGDNRRGRDKNDCDQVMQHVVSHVTLLGWLWIWKGHPLLPGQSATIVINGDEIVIAGETDFWFRDHQASVGQSRERPR